MRKEGDKFPLRMLVLITQLGINMMVPIFLCAWMGSVVSKKTGVDLLFVAFLILGIMAGFRSVYSLISRFVSLKSSAPELEARKPLPEEDEESDHDENDEMDKGLY